MISTFGAGCFWGVQERFSKLIGVTNTTVGYMGGEKENPTYTQVCYSNTGHTEVCQVEYDEKVISFKELLEEFFKMHDPKRKAKTQYKSVIFYHDEKQKKEAEKLIKKDYATELIKEKEFWKAENYHQNYFKKNKLAKFLCGV